MKNNTAGSESLETGDEASRLIVERPVVRETGNSPLLGLHTTNGAFTGQLEKTGSPSSIGLHLKNRS